MSPDSAQPQPPVDVPSGPAEAKPSPPAKPVEPPAAKLPPPAAPEPVAEPPPDAAPTAAAPQPAAPAALSGTARSRLRRVIAVGGTLLVLLIAWESFTYFVAYTDDAYVRSDLVAVAPEVTGRIIAVHVVDNQEIKLGAKLISIDPTPFQLEVNQRQAQIEEQTSLVKVAREQLATAQAALDAATSTHTYAVEQQARYAVLAASNNAPRAELDRANDELRRATAERSEEHTSELQSLAYLVCRPLLEKKKARVTPNAHNQHHSSIWTQ